MVIIKKVFVLVIVLQLLIVNSFTVSASGFKNKTKITKIDQVGRKGNWFKVYFKTPYSQSDGCYVYKYGGKKDLCEFDDFTASLNSKWYAKRIKVNTLYSYQSYINKKGKSKKKWFVPEIRIKEKRFGKKLKGKTIKFTLPSIKGIAYYKILFKKGNKGYKFLKTAYNNEKVKLKYTKKLKRGKFLYFRFIPYMSNGHKVKNLYSGAGKYSLFTYKN